MNNLFLFVIVVIAFQVNFDGRFYVWEWQWSTWSKVVINPPITIIIVTVAALVQCLVDSGEDSSSVIVVYTAAYVNVLHCNARWKIQDKMANCTRLEVSRLSWTLVKKVHELVCVLIVHGSDISVL